MNILILVRDFKSGSNIGKNGMPEKSGAEIHVERHARAFVRLGHNVTIMAKKSMRKTPIVEKINGIKLIRLISGLRSYMCIYFLIKHRKDIDVLYVFGQPSFNLTAVLVADKLHIPIAYVSTMAGEAFEPIKSDKYFGKFKPYRKYHDHILKKCTCLIAISREIGDEFIAHGIEASRVYVLPQGVALDKFYPISREDKIKKRANIGIDINKKIILFCSRLDYRKGIDIVLKTWREIEKKHSNAQLIIVGGGSQKYIEWIKKLIAEGSNIKYLGEVDRPTVYYQVADIFVLPSRKEGCPNVLMEAMACGCAPVVSRIGGCEDLVKDKDNGRLFSKDSCEEYKNVLSELLDSEAAISKYQSKSYEFCKKHLDVNCVAESLISKFKNI